MSHGVTQIDAIAYNGEMPWHGVNCNHVEAGSDLQTWIDSANMGFTVLKRRMRYAGESADDIREVDGQIVMVRSDTFAPLGTGSDRFQIVQPRDVAEFFREVSDNLTTMGTLHGGRRFWAMSTFDGTHDAIVADKRDVIRPHLLMSTAVDGSMATQFLWTAIRVVCNNTLQWAIGDAGKDKISVTHRSKLNMQDVKRQLGFESAQTGFDATMAKFRQLAATRMSDDGMLAMTTLLFYPDFASYDDKKRDKVLRSKQVEAVARLAIDKTATGSDYDGASGTAYAWLNAVTEYVDHAEKKTGQSVDNRISSAYFGPGAAAKNQAMEMALNYAPSIDDLIASTNRVFARKEESTGGLLDAVLDATVPL